MDTARQVIRWSIPGAILMLTALVVNLLSAAWERTWRDHTSGFLDVATAEVAFITLATIPVGYLTYQIYYYRDGRVRRFPRGMLPINRGYHVLRQLQSQTDLGVTVARFGYADLGILKLDAGSITDLDERRPVASSLRHWPVNKAVFPNIEVCMLDAQASTREEFYVLFKMHNTLVRTLLMALSSDDTGKSLVVEYTSLSDLYHGLGATRTALTLGVPTGALFLLLTPGRSVLGVVVAATISSLLAFWIYWIVHRNRSQVLDRLTATTFQGLNWLLTAPTTPTPPSP